MRVFIYPEDSTRALNVRALEGKHQGCVIATLEQVMLKDAQFVPDELDDKRAGVIGEIEAVWGAEIFHDLDNETIAGLAINKPFRPFRGEQVAVCTVLGKRASRVKLDGNQAWASGLN